MNNVLIAIDSCESSFWMAFYALSLARRVRAKVSILMVVDEELSRMNDPEEWIGTPETHLESLIAEQNSDAAHVDYYVAKGAFADEVARFIGENGTTSLIVGKPDATDSKSMRAFMSMIEEISKRTRCHIDIVQKNMSIEREK
ncbi:MAG: universal stress protein [Desulfovibrionaceae bacterium]